MMIYNTKLILDQHPETLSEYGPWTKKRLSVSVRAVSQCTPINVNVNVNPFSTSPNSVYIPGQIKMTLRQAITREAIVTAYLNLIPNS
jgi:hypothetical protein